MLSTTTTAREARVRRQLDRDGYALRKSRGRRWTCDDHQGYMIVEANRNMIVAGSRFDLDLDEVEEWARSG